MNLNFKNLTDKQTLQLNSLISFINRILTVLYGLIIPKLIIDHYGSEINGLVQSINQFLSLIVLLDFGLGTVVESALYKPLAQKNFLRINEILSSAKDYFQKIAYVLIIYVNILIIIYPKFINSQLDIISTGFLIFAISMSIFFQFYFGLINELLLNADRKAYIQLITEILVIILNIIVTFIFINLDYPIYIVKFFSGIIFLLRPILLQNYVKNNYNINLNVKYEKEPIPQKWNGVAQHIAYSVNNSSSIVILSFFSNLEDVSIFSVYNMIVNGMKLLVTSVTGSIKAYLGNYLAVNNTKKLTVFFNNIEWLIHNLVIFLFSVTASLITSFVSLYTKNATDVDYRAPIFAVIFVSSQIIFSIRSPYQNLVLAAGHYRQTQRASIIEVLINILTTLTLLKFNSLIAIGIGTTVSSLYRTVYIAHYISKNIILREVKIFYKYLLLDILIYVLVLSLHFYLNFKITNIFNWITYGITMSFTTLIFIFLINFIFNKKQTIISLEYFLNKS
ncbi:lipopolysaccharide biosynthesis protein [Facklamia sp. P12934]